MYLDTLRDFLPKEITPEHRLKYDQAIGNWTYCAYFLANEASSTDIYVMLKMELDGKRRHYMIDRLIGRLANIYRLGLKAEVKQLMARGKTA